MVGGRNNIGMVPPVDAVQEFKIVTNAYDAQYGRTSGGAINVSLKSGSNTYHGSVYEFARRNFMDANYLVSNYRGIPAGQFQNPDGTLSEAPHLLDQYGFQINGPVWIPKLYNGRNKTFFLFSFEDYNEQSPGPEVRTVPTDEFLRVQRAAQLPRRRWRLPYLAERICRLAVRQTDQPTDVLQSRHR